MSAKNEAPPLKTPRNYINHSKNSFNVIVWALGLGDFQVFLYHRFQVLFFTFFGWLGGR